MNDPVKLERIRAQVDQMVKAKAPPEDIERFLASQGVKPDRAPEPTSAPEETEDKLPLGQRIAGGLSAGLGILPGGQALMAGIGAIGEPTYKESLRTLEESQAAAPWALKRGMQAAGLVGSMALTPLKVLQGARGAGALFGGGLAATQRAMEATPESLGRRALGTALAGGVGAGLGYTAPWMMGHAVPRTLLGGSLGAALGWDVAPEGNKMTGAATGAAAGGALAASPTKTIDLVQKGARRVAPRMSDLLTNVQETLGIRGEVNKTLKPVQELLDEIGVGGKVGKARGGVEVLGDVAERGAQASTANYGQALNEGNRAWTAYQQSRADVIDENVNRMLTQIQQDAEETAERLSQTTVQSATARRPASTREAIENLRAASAEAARRRGPEGTASPFVGRAPRAQGVVEEGRFGAFQRPALGTRETELGRMPGSGEPTFVDPSAGRLPTSTTGAAPASRIESPYRPSTMREALEEARPGAGAFPSRTTTQTPIGSQEPTLQFPEPVNRAVRRGDAPTAPRTTPAARTNETSAQQAAREALERRAAYEALPANVRPAQRPSVPGQLPVPDEVHPAVVPMYQNAQVAKAAEAVRKLDAFRHLAPDDPRFVDEVYKVISDAKMAAGKRIGTAESPVNFLRATQAELQDAQNAILQTTDGLMPTYRKAVDEHAAFKAWERAFKRGYDAVVGQGNTAKGRLARSPAAVERWIAAQPKGELRDAAREGARYALNDVVSSVPITAGAKGVVAQRPFRPVPMDTPRRQLAAQPGLERKVGQLREVAADQLAGPIRLWLPGIKGHALAQAVNSVLLKNPLEQKAAQPLINAILADPDNYQQTLRRFGMGQQAIKEVERQMQAQVGLWTGR